MAKSTPFRVGDIVEILNSGHQYSTYDEWAKRNGATKYVSGKAIPKGNYRIKRISGHGRSEGSMPLGLLESMDGLFQYIYGLEEYPPYIQLSTKGETVNTTRRTFRLLKDTPDLKKGVLVQEACDDGDQEYNVLDLKNYVKHDDFFDFFGDANYSRQAVEQQPTWFEEVFAVTPPFMNAKQIEQWEAFQKSQATKTKKSK